MRLAFTGTQRGITVGQRLALMELLRLGTWTAHGNGLCVGADAEMFKLVMVERPDVRRVGFPCTISSKQARTLYRHCHEIRTPLPPMERNTRLVEWACEHGGVGGALIATPGEVEEQVRSGTWATIRRARKLVLPIIYVWPDGTFERRAA